MDSETDSSVTNNPIEINKEEKKKLNEAGASQATATAVAAAAAAENNKPVEIKQDYNACYICKQIVIWILKYLVSLLLGLLFGYAMEKAKVYEPKAIRQQMIFRRFVMLKMFLAAFATSSFAILLTALICKKR